MSPVVAVAEIVVMGREIVAAHPQTAARDLHRLVVLAARPRQIVHAHLHDVEDAHLPLIAQGLHRVDRGILHLRDASDGMEGETSHGLRAMTAGGYPGINHDLLPLKRNRAHQHPGCQGPDPAHRRAAAAQDQAVHGL